MDIEAVVFDKDGTLLDFDAFWIEISKCVINDIKEKLGAENVPNEKLLSAIGVSGTEADENGLLCKGTYEEIGLAFCGVLKEYKIDIDCAEAVRLTEASFVENADAGEVKAACDNIRDVLLRAKEGGRKLLVVTMDNPEITRKCLCRLGIDDLFDEIYTDDGNFPPKPDPQCIREFSASYGIPPEKMVMVGDTMTDILFARAAGMSVIYVGKSESVGKKADAALSDISHIFEVIGEEKA